MTNFKNLILKIVCSIISMTFEDFDLDNILMMKNHTKIF